MKIEGECFSCFLHQANRLLNMLKVDREKKIDILKKVSRYISDIRDYNKSPAFYASNFYKMLYESTSQTDPYLEVKIKYNNLIFSYKKKIEQIIKESKDAIYTALKFSAIGNIIDFGVEVPIKIEEEIEQLEKINFVIDYYEVFKEKLKRAKKIMLLCDNAGEVIFDIILLETISLKYNYELILGVKGEAIINDITIDDLKRINIPDNIKIVSNGNSKVGTILEFCSDKFMQEFYSSDIIISKGQANFETLNDFIDKEIFFLFRAKCDVVSRYLKVNNGDILFWYNRR